LSELKIFFATDIHGSDICFRKFINAGKAYQADAIIMGGDITGKLIVPIVETKKGVYSLTWLEAPYTITEVELPAFTDQIRRAGCYAYRTTPDEMAYLEEDAARVKELFVKILKQSVADWLTLAEERLAGTGIECFITPGNDDALAIDAAFDGQQVICNPEGKLLHIKGEWEMISTGYTNPTPWNTARELDEDKLFQRIDQMASQLIQPQYAIFNFHCPPQGVGLDVAPRLDKSLKPVTGIGGVEMGDVGSLAVLKAIQAYHPLLGLHGHVHESRGAVRIGKTLCINPGSEYTEGILRGCLILADKKKGVKDYLLTSG
jgi:uncharacterized protein